MLSRSSSARQAGNIILGLRATALSQQRGVTTEQVEELKEYLWSKGFDTINKTAIKNSFAKSPLDINGIKSLDKEGLTEFSNAILQEQEKLKAEKYQVIPVIIDIPLERVTLELKAAAGESIIDLVKRNADLSGYLECACGGIAACSTCHVIVDEQHYAQLPQPEEPELDMIDLAKDVTDTSRLGCQISIPSDMKELRLTLPKSFNNLF